MGVGECTCKGGKGFAQRCCVGTGMDTKLLGGVCTGAGIVWGGQRGEAYWSQCRAVLVSLRPPDCLLLSGAVLSWMMGAPLALK